MTSETTSSALSRDALTADPAGRPNVPGPPCRGRAGDDGRRAPRSRGSPCRRSGWRSPVCSSRPRSSTCGGWGRPAGPTRSTPPPRRPARSRGRRSSSAPPTPPTRSPSTRRRSRSGRWGCRCGSSGSRRGASSCRRRSRAWRPSGCCTPRSGVRRDRRGPRLLAGAVMALTPVAVLMFRFNNPDAMLVLLLVGSAYATLRAVEASVSGATAAAAAARWLAFAGVLVGLAFLAKMLQSFLVIPALVAVYALYAGVTWRRKLLHLLAAAAGMVARRRLVDRDRDGVAGRVAPLHRRLAAQLDPRAHPRLQRLRPPRRLGDRLGRRREHHGRPVGRDRAVPDVRLRGRHPGRLADPGRPGPRCRRPVVRPRPRRAGGTRRADAVARLAARHRPHLQLHGRDLPPVLHRRPGARDRRPRRDRRRSSCGGTATRWSPPACSVSPPP